MEQTDIRWNEAARNKILDDSDRVLQTAVLDLAKTMSGSPSDDIYAELNGRLKDRFIDYEPGPDVRKYADAISSGEFGGDSAGAGSAASGSTGAGIDSDLDEDDLEVNDG